MNDSPLSLAAVLCGGPPWGFRIGQDREKRPVIARTIPGGRADLAGMKEGDVIESVNSIPVDTSIDAQMFVQEMKGSGDLRMKVNRLNNTPADVVLTSVLESPAPLRKEFPSSFPSRSSSSSSSNYSPHLPRSLRLEGNQQQRTQDKRRFFESLGGTPRGMRDPLLARKIQMGLMDMHAPPSENGTIVSGYDSVFGDICGTGSRISSQASNQSDIPSSVNSINGDEENNCDQTLSLDHPENTPKATSHLNNQFSPSTLPPPPLPSSSPFSILFHPPPPPPFDPTPEPSDPIGRLPPYRPPSRSGVPDYDYPQPRSFTPQPLPPPPKPSHIPIPTLSTSRTPVSPPPLSPQLVLQLQRRSPSPVGRPPAGPPPPSPPPLSPPPLSPSHGRSELRVQIRSQSPAAFSAPPPPAEDPPPIAEDRAMEPAGPSQWNMKMEFANVGPAQCEIEVPGRRSVAALREQIATQLDVRSPEDSKPSRPKTPVKSWIKVHEPDHSSAMGFGRVLDGPPTAAANFYQGVPPPSYNFVPHKNQHSPQKSSHPSARESSSSTESTESRAPSYVGMIRPAPEIERAELHIQNNGFGNDIHSNPLSHSSVLIEARARSCTTPVPIRERPSIERVSVERAVLQSGDLESAELQARHSASYSSLNSDHLGTIRRRPKSSEKERASDSGLHDSPDSGYDASPESRKDSMLTVRSSTPPPPFSPESREAFTSLPPSALTKIDIELPKKHEEAPFEEQKEVTKVDAPCSPNYKRDDSDMGSWYRDMFKQLHKIEGGDASILKYRLNENNSSRPNTPSRRPSSPSPSSVSTAIEVETRRAKSVGRDPLPSTSHSSLPPAPSQREVPTKGSTPGGLNLADEIETLKRITTDEMTSLRAERLGEELDRERARRHGYQPNAVPSLAHNTDRFTGLLNAYGDDRGHSPARSTSSGVAVRTAVVLYRFVPQSERELALNKGDIVRLRREIDGNWVEGERNGRVGIFPASYVDLEECVEPSLRQRLRAVYPFTGRNLNEMSLKIGDVVTFRRHIDENWTEGVNHIGEIGIFPTCYVRPIEEIQQEMNSVVPDRPKTPKLPGVSFGAMSQSTRDEPAFERNYDRLDRRSAEPMQQVQQQMPVQNMQPMQQLHQPIQHQPMQSQQQPNGHNIHQVEIQLPHPVPEASAHAEASRDQQARSRVIDPHQLDETLEDLLRSLPTSTSTPKENGRYHQNHAHFEAHSQPMNNGQNGFYEPARERHGALVSNGVNGHREEHHGDDYHEAEYPTPAAAHQPNAAASAAAPASSQNDKVAAWQQKHSSSGYTGTASIIPKGAKTYRALYPYSPQNEDELELRVDDIIFVVEKCDDGWFIGTLLRTGQFGTFPGNFVEEH